MTVIVRKAYGGGYAVMGSKQLAADLNFAWPTARIAVIGAEGAAQLLVKRFPDPTAPEVQKIRADFIEGYNLNMATPWIAAERGYIDAVIQPHETRLLLRKSMRLLRDKQIGRVQRKHGLTPIKHRGPVAVSRRPTNMSSCAPTCLKTWDEDSATVTLVAPGSRRFDRVEFPNSGAARLGWRYDCDCVQPFHRSQPRTTSR